MTLEHYDAVILDRSIYAANGIPRHLTRELKRSTSVQAAASFPDSIQALSHLLNRQELKRASRTISTLRQIDLTLRTDHDDLGTLALAEHLVQEGKRVIVIGAGYYMEEQIISNSIPVDWLNLSTNTILAPGQYSEEWIRRRILDLYRQHRAAEWDEGPSIEEIFIRRSLDRLHERRAAEQDEDPSV